MRRVGNFAISGSEISSGMLEGWNGGILGHIMKTSALNEIEFLTAIVPILHYSNIPIGAKTKLNSLNL
jgi:hypothetical protein